jgi:peptide deformylase
MAEPAPILLLGDPRLRRVCRPVTDFADPAVRSACAALSATLADFRRRHGFGRAIAAPQIGVDLRIVAMDPAHGPPLLLNPEIIRHSAQSMTLWDDCMSFPDLLVRLCRYRSISLRYRDPEGHSREWHDLEPAASELLQHEIDHLDGVLAIEHALDREAIVLRAAFEARPARFRSQVDWPPAAADLRSPGPGG